MQKIKLSEMLVNLRQELVEAQKIAAKEDLKFNVGDIEVELQFTTTMEAQGKGGVKFWVYNAEAGGKLSSQTLHKIKLSLKPELPGGGDVKISDKRKRPK
ncbi:MAG: hypothetical protein GY807_09610 [Gammaproteobacteria bacterium]|nr:hypothetical protein [Gammaproteobacteria bacterium]